VKGGDITTLCLVGCCKTKLRRAAPAKELYCSALFRLCREWAERHADAWAILSARYGVVRPDEVIEPYDATVADRRPFGGPPLSPGDYSTWLYSHVQVWRCRYATRRETPRLVVLAGKEYWQCLVEHGLEVVTPLDGLGIGERICWLKRQTAACAREVSSPLEQPYLFDAP
jgi:hypothetical protein